MSANPYAAPKTHVADVPLAGPDGSFLREGQSVSAGNGWNWISQAWQLNGQQRGTWIGIFVLFGVIVIVMSLIPFLGTLLLALVTPVLYGGIMQGCEAQRKGQRIEVGHLFAGFRNHTGKLVAVGVFTLLAFLAILVLVGLIFGFSMMAAMMGAEPTPEQMAAGMMGMLLGALVATGLSIPVYMAIWFSTPLITLNDLEVGDALKKSFQACLKNILPFLVWGFVMFVLAIVASIPLMLGWLLLGPVLLASVYTAYRDIFYAG